MTTQSNTRREESRVAERDSGWVKFHNSQGKRLNGRGGLQGVLKGQGNKTECSRKNCNSFGEDGF